MSAAKPTQQRVLIVDDDPDILELLTYNLSKVGYEVAQASNGKEAIEVTGQFKPHIILLDVMMPKLDGIAACATIRTLPAGKEAYILFLTARSEEFSEIAAFEAGADDFIVKPIKPKALLSRLAAVVRRGAQQGAEEETITIANLTINRTSFYVEREGTRITLPKKEFELLAFLAATPNKVFTRDELLSGIWGNDVFVIPRTVDVHIRKVREKIGEEHIKTIKGVGYKFNND